MIVLNARGLKLGVNWFSTEWLKYVLHVAVDRLAAYQADQTTTAEKGVVMGAAFALQFAAVTNVAAQIPQLA